MEADLARAMPVTDLLEETRAARVLVAEDDLANLSLTTHVLVRAGHEVVSRSDGRDVLDVVAAQDLDLLLLDIGLPSIDGLRITRRLRADRRYATLPILLLTGRVADADVVQGLDAGANDYITKPVQPAILLARVRSALRTRRALLGIEAAHAVVAALANAIEAKDVSTERHSRRLGAYAAALATVVGLEREELHAVTYGALLHDIGKIGVPERVLLKPGPLDAAEWELMRRHTEIGEHIAAPLVGSARFGPIIRHHHERWDGHGYPDRLRGDAIPLGARIVGVVDAFDAITRPRVYRAARTASEALEEIRRARGHQFDPALADAFVILVERMGPRDGSDHDVLEEPDLTLAVRAAPTIARRLDA